VLTNATQLAYITIMNRIVKELMTRSRKDFSPEAYLAAPVGSDGVISYTSPNSYALKDGLSEAERSQTFVICDIAEDREGDIVDPRGCLPYLSEYSRNSIICYEHDATLGAIGLSKSPAGVLSLDIQPTKIIAKCYYHCRPFRGENLSAECWELARAGVLLGASIGFLPIESERVGYGKGLRFTKWRLTEWSNTFLPVHQATLQEDVLRNSLSRGKIKSIQLRQRIESILPPAKVWSPGAEIKSMSSKKLKTGAIEFDASIFSPEQAEAYLRTYGHKSFAGKTELPGVLVFSRPDISLIPGSRKSLGNGVAALMGVKKAMNDDEDEDKDDYTENPDAEADAAETHDEPDGDETATGDEPETPETDEAETETEATADAGVSEETAAQARDLVNVIVHFESLLEALPGMAQHPELSDKYAKIQADAESLVADLNEAFKEKFADHAIEQLKQSAMAGDVAPVEPVAEAPVEDVPVEDIDEDTPDMDEDEIKKALTKARREAGRVKSGMVRLAKAFSGVA